jgi:membrane peptidoglycan carboxypeptidase
MSFWWRWLLGMALLGVALMGLWMQQIASHLPDPRPLRDPAWVQQHFSLGTWTQLDQVPRPALRCILISEDDTFFQNHGVRMDEMGAAAWDDLLAGRYKRGASSITQQVVRNAFLSKDKTLSRKLREIFLASRADSVVGKRRLLEDYLNLAQWGHPQERGIAWASRQYFGKSVPQLSAIDGAYLSWLLPDPPHRSQAARRGEMTLAARRHVRLMLRRLARENDLSDEDTAALLASPFRLGGLAQAPLKP